MWNCFEKVLNKSRVIKNLANFSNKKSIYTTKLATRRILFHFRSLPKSA